MPKGGSGADTYTGAVGGPVNATGMMLAGHAVMNAAAVVIENAAARLPELEPFLNMIEFNQADISTRGVLGFYDTVGQNAVIGNRTVSTWKGTEDSGLAVPTWQGVVVHEVGHGLSYHVQPGFRPVENAMRIARASYNRGRAEKLGEGSFAGAISRYARSGPHEAFAEAFSDWSINGINANPVSRAIIKAWKGSGR